LEELTRKHELPNVRKGLKKGRRVLGLELVILNFTAARAAEERVKEKTTNLKRQITRNGFDGGGF